MAKANVQFTKDNEYYTPAKTVNFFGPFDYDPATTKEKAAEFGITSFDTIETNGLEQDWTPYNKIWINPPFTDKHLFMQKAQETFDKTGADIFILFPIEFMTTQRFHDHCTGGHVYVPSGRINFESGLGKKGKSPAFGCVVMKLQKGWSMETLDKDLIR